MNHPNDPTDITSIQSQKDKALAKRKLATVSRLLGEICQLTNKPSISVSFSSIRLADKPATSSPSHAPSRHPESPLPPPKYGRRTIQGHLHDALSYELERRKEAVAKWREVNGQPTPPTSADFIIRHHDECASHRLARDCDCGRLFLARIDGHVFVVNADGSLERYTRPSPTVAEFLADDFKFHQKLAWNTGEWMRHVWIDSYEFTEFDGEFEDEPTEYEVPTPIEDHE